MGNQVFNREPVIQDRVAHPHLAKLPQHTFLVCLGNNLDHQKMAAFPGQLQLLFADLRGAWARARRTDPGLGVVCIEI